MKFRFRFTFRSKETIAIPLEQHLPMVELRMVWKAIIPVFWGMIGL